MWSRVASLLDHRGGARRRQAREQHRRLELRRRHRRPRIRSGSDRGRPAASAAAGRPRRSSSARAPIRSSGSRMRRIGRVRRQASPSNVAVIGQPATAPMARRQPVPELPKSSGGGRLREAADADAAHPPGPLAGALDRRAQRPHGVGGADGVLALQQAGDARFRRPSARPGSASGAKSTCRRARGRGRSAARSGGRSAARLDHGVAPRSAVLARSDARVSCRRARDAVPTLLTAALPAAKGSTAFPSSGPFQGFPNRGKTRARHQASLRQLRRQILRSRQGPDRLPEVRDGVRRRAGGARPRR